MITQSDVISMLRDSVSVVGSQKAYAELSGVDRITINRILKGKEEPSKRLLEYMGLKKITIYEWVKQV